jgi:hypothetical protein
MLKMKITSKLYAYISFIKFLRKLNEHVQQLIYDHM